MGKSSSSSSFRKKRSKDSLKSRSRKRNKNSKTKFKKRRRRRRRHDSLSYSDDSDSTNSVSLSSSSSKYDCRRRKDVKGRKKRSLKEYSTSDSSEDSGCLRKQKVSKRKDGYEGRKRSRSKQKRIRDVSVSSASSESCSTCSTWTRSSNDENEFQRKRGRSKSRGKERRRLDKVRSRTKRSRDRSRSCSSCAWGSESNDYQNKEQFTGDENIKRLRSVITVVKNDDEEGNKEEMVYDHDDYPSCRSNDSNDMGNKRDLEHHSHVMSEEKMLVDYDKGAEAVISVAMTSTDMEERKDGSSNGLGTQATTMGKTSHVSDPNDSLNGDDLESVLRKRALENLRRFREVPQTNAAVSLKQRDKSDSKMIPSTTMDGSIQIQSAKVDESPGIMAPQLQQISIPAVRKDSQNSRKVPDENDSQKESRFARPDFSSPLDQQVGGTPKEKASSAVSSFARRRKLVRSVWRRESSNISTITKQVTESQEPQAKLTAGDNVHSAGPETCRSSSAKNGKCDNAHDTTGQSSSHSKPESGNGNSDKPQEETKEGTQYEQKTMSVMRGGEMVEVSYKVYIPKKTPALARRTLKR